MYLVQKLEVLEDIVKAHGLPWLTSGGSRRIADCLVNYFKRSCCRIIGLEKYSPFT